MRSIALALILAVPACTAVPDPAGPEPEEEEECGTIPELQVRGPIEVTLTRAEVGETCPFVYDRRTYRFTAYAGGDIQTDDTPAVVEASTIDSEVEEAYVWIELTDEWGVGTTDSQTFAPGSLDFDLTFAADGSISGAVTGSVPYDGGTCVIVYSAAGVFAPEWE